MTEGMPQDGKIFNVLIQHLLSRHHSISDFFFFFIVKQTRQATRCLAQLWVAGTITLVSLDPFMLLQIWSQSAFIKNFPVIIMTTWKGAIAPANVPWPDPKCQFIAHTWLLPKFVGAPAFWPSLLERVWLLDAAICCVYREKTVISDVSSVPVFEFDLMVQKEHYEIIKERKGNFFEHFTNLQT